MGPEYTLQCGFHPQRHRWQRESSWCDEDQERTGSTPPYEPIEPESATPRRRACSPSGWRSRACTLGDGTSSTGKNTDLKRKIEDLGLRQAAVIEQADNGDAVGCGRRPGGVVLPPLSIQELLMRFSILVNLKTCRLGLHIVEQVRVDGDLGLIDLSEEERTVNQGLEIHGTTG